ncbi:MAG: pyridoxine 5'-phosphate synthase [Planctomycetota bacterium]|nr:pyridoxine 5'-phosphate synthase [Planctomycetota bacterium]
MIRLGVNIDHVATIRQARMTDEPDPVRAAVLAELGGADGITVHLREDARHIQKRDVRLLARTIRTPLNLELALWEGVLELARELTPHQATFVPEKREEITTEGGLDVCEHASRLKNVVSEFRERGIHCAMFIDPSESQVEKSVEIGAHAVEFHTGAYANAESAEKSEQLDRLFDCALHAMKAGLSVHAGHGLTYENVRPILEMPGLEEVNIGHSIISRAVLTGIEAAVADMKDIILRYC